jgi:PGF-CTERM protein
MNGAGQWSRWFGTDGITVSAGANSATVSYTNGVQNDPVIRVQLGGTTAGGARITDGDLEVRKATYYRGEVGTWGPWMEVGPNGGDLTGADYGGERGYAYQFRYRIKSEFNVWSGYSEAGYFVRINAPPVAVAGTDTSTVVGKKLSFDGTGSWDPDGDAAAGYEWNFGDKSKPDAKAATSHTFKKAGTFTVTLTVSDGNLNVTSTIYIKVRNPDSGSTPGFGGGFALLAVGAALALMLRRRKNGDAVR